LSEPALVGVITADGTFTGRYLHWAGYSTDTVAALRAIWADRFRRDTTAMVAALLAHDWHSLNAASTQRRPPTGTTRITGVGHAFGTGLATVRGNVATAARHGYTEWMYLIDTAAPAIRVYEATVHDRWLIHSLHPLDPGTAPPSTDRRFRCGDRVMLEHTDDPHTHLRPGDEGTVAADQPVGAVQIRWDSGSTLAMLLDSGDRIRLLAPSPGTTSKHKEESR
jgi:hypothetical protein